MAQTVFSQTVFGKFTRAAFVAFIFLLGAGFAAITPETNSANVVLNSAEPIQTPVTRIVDRGDFKVGFAPSRRRSRREYIAADDRRYLQSVADNLNQTFALPRDIYINYDECGEPNAYYDLRRHQIVICQELFSDLDEIFKAKYRRAAARTRAVNDAAAFIFYHELGHALVHVYDLPIRENEEDAVDKLSTLILADGSDEGAEMALHGAESFGLLGDENEDERQNFWDEHSLNSQRYHNINCLVYGRNPQKYAYLSKNRDLGEKEAAQCVDEFKKVEKNWTRLLAPYLKKSSLSAH